MTTLSTFEPAEPEVIHRLFSRLHAFYGSKFVDSFAGVPLETMGEVWSEELAGYTQAELNRGVAYCRTKTWPPTLPEFLCAARPPVDPESAFVEAVENMGKRGRLEHAVWSHPAIYHAAREIVFDMKRIGWVGMGSRWTRILNTQLALESWPPIPPLPAGLLAAPDASTLPRVLPAGVAALVARFRAGTPRSTPTPPPADAPFDFVASVS